MEQFGNFSFKAAKPGTKASNSTRPELIVTPTINKFTLNNLGADKLGLEHGDFVTITENQNAEDFDGRYFISKSYGESYSKLAATNKSTGGGVALHFSYSGVYSKMLQEDVSAYELSPEGLVEKGLAQVSETESGNKSYTITKKIYFEIGEPMEVEIGDETVTLYPLTNSKTEEYKPRNKGGQSEPEDEESAE